MSSAYQFGVRDLAKQLNCLEFARKNVSLIQGQGRVCWRIHVKR